MVRGPKVGDGTSEGRQPAANANGPSLSNMTGRTGWAVRTDRFCKTARFYRYIPFFFSPTCDNFPNINASLRPI